MLVGFVDIGRALASTIMEAACLPSS